MKKLVFAITVLLSQVTFAGPECTKEPQDKWLNQEAFKKSLTDKGYKIKVFKVTKGNCYEIYGWNKEGEKIEIYFDPTSGSIVKEETH